MCTGTSHRTTVPTPVPRSTLKFGAETVGRDYVVGPVLRLEGPGSGEEMLYFQCRGQETMMTFLTTPVQIIFDRRVSTVGYLLKEGKEG